MDHIIPMWIGKWSMRFITSGIRAGFKLNHVDKCRKNGVVSGEPLEGSASSKACPQKVVKDKKILI